MDNTDYGHAFAQSTADAAGRNVQDALVLIGWLIDRISVLEGILAEIPAPCPILPSRINGFNCINLRAGLVRDALAKAE